MSPDTSPSGAAAVVVTGSSLSHRPPPVGAVRARLDPSSQSDDETDTWRLLVLVTVTQLKLRPSRVDSLLSYIWMKPQVLKSRFKKVQKFSINKR